VIPKKSCPIKPATQTPPSLECKSIIMQMSPHHYLIKQSPLEYQLPH